MRRILLMLSAAAVLLAACGGASTESTSAETAASEPAPTTLGTVVGDQPSDSVPDTAQVDEAPAQDDEPAVAHVTDFDGPPASDFTVDLNKTGAFVLSEEARPVYLVFWAEW